MKILKKVLFKSTQLDYIQLENQDILKKCFLYLFNRTIELVSYPRVRSSNCSRTLLISLDKKINFNIVSLYSNENEYLIAYEMKALYLSHKKSYNLLTPTPCLLFGWGNLYKVLVKHYLYVGDISSHFTLIVTKAKYLSLFKF